MSDASDRLAGLDSARLAQLAEREAKLDEARSQPDAPDLPAGFVVQGHGSGYFVKSSTQEGVFWLVAGKSCSCPAGRAGRERCTHRRQVAAFVAKLNESMKRPVAPVNVSAMVD